MSQKDAMIPNETLCFCVICLSKKNTPETESFPYHQNIHVESSTEILFYIQSVMKAAEP